MNLPFLLQRHHKALHVGRTHVTVHEVRLQDIETTSGAVRRENEPTPTSLHRTCLTKALFRPSWPSAQTLA